MSGGRSNGNYIFMNKKKAFQVNYCKDKEDKGKERKCSRSSMSHDESTRNSNTKTLNNSDLHYLIRKTRFTKHEIKEWFE